MDISAGQLLINGISASAIITALVWAVGTAGLPSRLKPIVSDALGLLGGVVAVVLIPPPSGADALATILLWLGAGITASGFYSQIRTVAGV